jgi:hypothetical protein
MLHGTSIHTALPSGVRCGLQLFRLQRPHHIPTLLTSLATALALHADSHTPTCIPKLGRFPSFRALMASYLRSGYEEAGLLLVDKKSLSLTSEFDFGSRLAWFACGISMSHTPFYLAVPEAGTPTKEGRAAPLLRDPGENPVLVCTNWKQNPCEIKMLMKLSWGQTYEFFSYENLWIYSMPTVDECTTWLPRAKPLH